MHSNSMVSTCNIGDDIFGHQRWSEFRVRSVREKENSRNTKVRESVASKFDCIVFLDPYYLVS